MTSTIVRRACAAIGVAAAMIAANTGVAATAAPAGGHYGHFKTAIYIPVNVTQSLVDPQVFEHQFARAMGQVPFDQVYIEGYRDAHQHGGPGDGQFIVADMNRYGVVHVSTAGRGIAYGRPAQP